MAVQKGKRRRRTRRRDRDGEECVPVAEATPKGKETAPRPRRGAKPLKERSPIVAAAISVFCVIGAIITAIGFHKQLDTHHVLNFLFIALYLVLAAVQAFLAVKIYQARGGWR
jgi:hypothetical protein